MSQTSSFPAELLRGDGLPEFSAISAASVQDAIPQLLKGLSEQLEAIEADLQAEGPITWAMLMPPLHQIGERLRWSWGVIGHLLGVCNTTELREAHQSQQAAVVRFSSRLGQSQPIYQGLKQLADQSHLLDDCQRRIVDQELLEMQLRGVGLEGAPQQRFNQLSEELSALSTRFSNNVLDATASWELLLERPEEVEGCPTSLLELLADAARNNGHESATAEAGPWLLGLDHPRYGPFLRFAARRDLRERAYRGFISRAAEGNRELVGEILKLRQEKADLLGYRCWADVSLASKMAPSVDAVEQLLEDLRAPAFSAAQAELSDLQALAGDVLQPWDVSYWAEKRRQQRFDLDSEALRPYFPLPQVLDGLFGLCQRLFGIRITAADGEAPLWHEDVRFFRVSDAQSGEQLAAFYLDPYSRPGSKRGGAWMDECLGRQRNSDGSLVLPVAYLICNQTPPVGEAPSLMSFDEVETLFHEFGHGLQHMLTTVEQPGAAGINGVEWDAVELPSQFMENWCYDGPTLDAIARHWQSGDALPQSERKKLLEARTFMAGSATLRQVHLALTDLRLHAIWRVDAGITPEQLRRQVAETTTVMPLLEEDALLCSFGHIFAGGYSAGYYSYKWAEVLSADAFSAFEDAGLDDEEALQDTGRRFRATVLSLGGSQAPTVVFERFRGREPSADALLRHSGLIAA
jgi:oligopeptidase A